MQVFLLKADYQINELCHAGAPALRLDPKLTWLAPGTPPNCADPNQIVSVTQPWFQSHQSRQAFVSRLLALLMSGPFPAQQSFCQALLVVEATHAASDCHPADIEALAGRLDLDRARAAAKKLLAQQRTNLGMWGAYASLESQAGQYKVGVLHAKLRQYVQCMLANARHRSAVLYCSLMVPATVTWLSWLVAP